MGLGAIGDTSGSAAFRSMSAQNAGQAKRAAASDSARLRPETDAVRFESKGASERPSIAQLASASRAGELRPEVVEAARERLAQGHADDPQVIADTVRRMLGDA